MNNPNELLRVHHVLRGRGAAFDDARRLSTVDYALRDVEELVAPDETPGSDASVGLGRRNIYGFLRTRHDPALEAYLGRRFELHLEDGRRLACSVAKVLPNGLFLVQALGELQSSSPGHAPVSAALLQPS